MQYGVKSTDTSKNNFNYPQNDIKLDWNRTFRFPETRKPGTIFVSIASYRDPRCPESLRTMFNGAQDPTKVFVGIVQQNKDDDMDCLEAYCIMMTSEKKNCLRENISVIRMSATDTRGVVVIRHMVSTMYLGEEFFLQIDAHSVFMEGWDVILKNQLKMVDYDRVVLSWHPPAFEVFESMGKKAKHMIVNLCVFNWDAHGLPRFSGQLLNGMNDRIKKPFPGIFVGAGGVFGRADFLKDCPFDPNYPSMFSGEELLMSACLFTYGWDLYNPSLSVIFHKYKDATNNVPVPVHWDNTLGSVQRLKFQLGVADKKPDDKWLLDVDKFKMGTVRPLSTYYQYGGVDWTTKKGDNLPFCNFRSEKIYHVKHPPGIQPLPVL